MHHPGQNQEDDTLDLLREFLPEIEAELRTEIEPQLKEEMHHIATQQIQRIEIQAQQEFQQALADLQLKFSQIEAEKKAILNQQITFLQTQLEEQERTKLAAAHEQLMFEKFDTDILYHPKLQQIQSKMQEEIAEILIQKYYANKARKEKELKVRIENKAQRERTQIDDTIRKEVTAKSGLAEVREELKHLRVEVASQKSKCNVRIKTIISETNQIMKKVKQQQQNNLQKIIADLQSEIDELKQRRMGSTQMETAQEVSEVEYHNFEHHNKQSSQNFSLYGIKREHQYIHEDVSFDSSRITESEQDYEHSEAQESDIPEPPEENMNQYYFHKEIVQEPQPAGPLLKFNVQKMIDYEWQDDEFDRFMRNEMDKQNTSSNRVKEQKSNFSTLYQQHLQNLNNKSRNKGKVKLSQRAKEQLLQNWQQQRYRT